MDKIKLFDVVALTEDLPTYKLQRGEIGAVVEVHPTGGYAVEFVSQDGYTYALITAKKEQLIALRQKPLHTSRKLVPATL
ncbi:MAG: DUF4926 domain-containing protein [Acidobacteriota bacterium]|nr:DUF4926 domain-containing protein [Acidobacteriota bacterium]